MAPKELGGPGLKDGRGHLGDQCVRPWAGPVGVGFSCSLVQRAQGRGRVEALTCLELKQLPAL